MNKLYYSALFYTILGLAGGLFYRTLTQLNHFTGDTQLAVVHTHFLVLGMIFFLGMLVLERVFTLSQSALFPWFFWIYNAGLLWTGGFMTFNGASTVVGTPLAERVAEMSGIGHVLLTVALLLLFAVLRSRLLAPQADATAPAGADRAGRPISTAA